MKRCNLLSCACPEVGVVILVREQGVRLKAAAKARQMTWVSQTKDCWYIVASFPLLFAPLGSPILEPNLLRPKHRQSQLLDEILENTIGWKIFFLVKYSFLIRMFTKLLHEIFYVSFRMTTPAWQTVLTDFKLWFNLLTR